jgi:hypothetical protein
VPRCFSGQVTAIPRRLIWRRRVRDTLLMSARARLWDAAANNALRLDKTIISRMSEACVRCDGTSPTRSGSCAIQLCFARGPGIPPQTGQETAGRGHAKPVSSIAEVAGWSLSVSLLSTSLPRCPRNHACLPACPYVCVLYAQ